DDHPDIRAAPLLQHVHHILEIFVVTPLIGAHGDRIRILLNGGTYDIRYAAVMTQVDHFRPVGLQQAPYHIDGGIVAIEERSRGNEAHRTPARSLLRVLERYAALTHGFYAPV